MSSPRSVSMSRQAAIKLQQPASVALYDDYADAQRAVDYLAGHQFPVQQLAIVGTDLRSLERVTGQLTSGKVLAAGFSRGIMWALMFAVLMWLLSDSMSFLTAFAFGVASFGLASAVMTWISYRSRGGNRDFTSRTTIIAGQYEVLAELDVVDRARNLLSGGKVHPTVEVLEQSSPAETAAQHATASQPIPDLATLPPPFGQQPVDAGEPPADQTPAAPGSSFDGQPTMQPPTAAQPLGPEQEPSGPDEEPPAEPTAFQQPCDSYWGASDEPGIGIPPKGFNPDDSRN